MMGKFSRLTLLLPPLPVPLLTCPGGIRDPHPPEAQLGKNEHGSFKIS